VTDAPDEEEGAAARPPQEMRLRSTRAPVTRLSRKVLLGLGTAAALGIAGALFLALKPQHQTSGSELYNTNNRNYAGWLGQPAEGLYRPAEIRPTARATAARRSRSADSQCRCACARHADAGRARRSGKTAPRPGAGSSAHQPSFRDHERGAPRSDAWCRD
jgi:hypothetical protein